MTEQDKPIEKSAEPQPETKPVRKSKQKKVKKKPKRDSHAHRPRATISYWVEGIEKGKFKGADLVQAIERVEAYEKERERKKLEKCGKHSNALRSILAHDSKAATPIDPKTVKKIVDIAKPQPKEMPPAPEPEITATPESASMTFDEMMQELAKQTKQIREETSESIAKRLRDVPVSEPDAATRDLINRAWSKAH